MTHRPGSRHLHAVCPCLNCSAEPEPFDWAQDVDWAPDAWSLLVSGAKLAWVELSAFGILLLMASFEAGYLSALP